MISLDACLFDLCNLNFHDKAQNAYFGYCENLFVISSHTYLLVTYLHISFEEVLITSLNAYLFVSL